MFDKRYGVPAINVFNDLTMDSVLATAVAERAPLIVQTSVKPVRSIGAATLFATWAAMTVLFDASELPVEEHQRQTVEVVAEARTYGAHVEGEIGSITGVEDDHGSDGDGERQPLDTVLGYG